MRHTKSNFNYTPREITESLQSQRKIKTQTKRRSEIKCPVDSGIKDTAEKAINVSTNMEKRRTDLQEDLLPHPKIKMEPEITAIMIEIEAEVDMAIEADIEIEAEEEINHEAAEQDGATEQMADETVTQDDQIREPATLVEKQAI